MSFPRILRSCDSFISNRFSELKYIEPLFIIPGSGIRFNIDNPVVDLPDPLSPTIPTIEFFGIDRLILSTAVTDDSFVLNCTSRLFISNKFSVFMLLIIQNLF